ncbi:MAG: hypothetical protein ACFCGT_15550 [Sandaracinaceae bacterium]
MAAFWVAFAGGLSSCCGAAVDTDLGIDPDMDSDMDSGDCPTPEALELVECMHPLNDDLVLDGQIVSCDNDFSIQATLILRNGSRLASSGRIFVEDGGSIITEGTEGCPIYITSNQDSPAPGDWSTFWVKESADNDSMLTHTVVEYGGDSNGAIRLTGGGTIGFDHVTVRHTPQVALALGAGTVTRFTAVSFSDIPDAPVEINANNAQVVEPDVRIEEETVADPFIDVVSGRMTVDGTWEALPYPYRLFGDLRFERQLTIGEGADIAVSTSSRFFVSNGGSINAMGTEDNPVTIRSSVIPGVPGAWNQITIANDAATNTTFTHTTISHGGGGGSGALSVNGFLTLENVTFSDNAECDIDEASNANITEIDSPYTSC